MFHYFRFCGHAFEQEGLTVPEFMQQFTDLHSWLPTAIGGFV